MFLKKTKRFFLLSVSISFLIVGADQALAQSGTENVIWFRSDNLKANFYTIDTEEMNQFLQFFSENWRYEGPAWATFPDVSDPNAKPVFRFYRESREWPPMAFYYTISEQQKNRIILTRPEWVYAGIAWYAYDVPRDGALPVYTFNLPSEGSFAYVYAGDVEDFTARYPGANQKGIAWYAFPADRSEELVPMEQVTGGCFNLGGQPGGIAWVCIDDFEMGRFEVTQSLWQAIMGEDPSRWFYQCDNCPVENVSWHEAQLFIERLNLVTSSSYRLPTEAEWEYACRSGGLDQDFCGGDDINSLAWYLDNAEGHPHDVGQLAPNLIGLYDLSGNVGEWTCSTFNSDYLDDLLEYPDHLNDALECGLQLSQGYRVVRGGSWSQAAGENSSTSRSGWLPTVQSPSIGLRLVRD
ncbi:MULTISPECIES: formylglycine-generating enzyme family protein [Thiorhodovibrio]|uniref:formylglycine-generating enzyme family protein n=1 Tax=Thiorhodovibrio TaxID=61593 RepID=UPI0019139450|nr:MULTISPECIES: formylglycine-generating enzyme family protein [Thiorhodovibrio]MBK5969726.1 hypothetical protein [Thiorhodovibrio winogradskyi]WPL13775.1 Serine/threonine-protein kinase pkn1 [Thiorhodovibrio litoralis]